MADVEARHRLRSSSSSSLIVSRIRLLTVGDRAFSVAAARVWNSLPDLVTSAPSVAVFRSWLKTRLFNISYPLWLYSACAVTLVALDTIIVLAYLLIAVGYRQSVLSRMFAVKRVDLPWRAAAHVFRTWQVEFHDLTTSVNGKHRLKLNIRSFARLQRLSIRSKRLSYWPLRPITVDPYSYCSYLHSRSCFMLSHCRSSVAV